MISLCWLQVFLFWTRTAFNLSRKHSLPKLSSCSPSSMSVLLLIQYAASTTVVHVSCLANSVQAVSLQQSHITDFSLIDILLLFLRRSRGCASSLEFTRGPSYPYTTISLLKWLILRFRGNQCLYCMLVDDPASEFCSEILLGPVGLWRVKTLPDVCRPRRTQNH